MPRGVLELVGVAQDNKMHSSPSLWLFVCCDPMTRLILLLGSSKIEQFWPYGFTYLSCYCGCFYLINCYNVTNLNTNMILKGVLKY
ncbi:hypothetical protein HanRHA438_Chr15g0724371 [Helianthus annuus]|nr:hypothetical protein HanRHA438_Chr15g0724371 [Helianthus annuus]